MKFQLLIILFFISLTTLAQHTKGDWAFSIAASPYPIEVLGENDFGLIGLAQVEFFVSDKISFSTSLFTTDNDTFQNDSDQDITSYGIIPGIQYYFLNKEKFNVFGQVGYGLGFKSDTTTNIDNEALRVYSIGAGGLYKISDVLHLKLFLPYFNAKDITFNRGEASGVAVFLGLQFTL